MIGKDISAKLEFTLADDVWRLLEDQTVQSLDTKVKHTADSMRITLLASLDVLDER